MSSDLIRVRSLCKINLALAVLGRRSDGFHEIRTVFQSIDLCDEITFRKSRWLSLDCEGLDSVPPAENLVWRAAEALSRHASLSGAGAEMVLKKRVPAGAGLGGGSSNAATALLGLSRLWDLDLPPEQMEELARGLGSDVPFFLHGGTALGIGRGEEIYPLPEFPAAHLVVVFPGVRISTAEAYRSLSLRLTSERSLHKMHRFCGRLASGEGCLAGIFNDFETSILPAYPAVAEARGFLAERGAAATLLSGSGSSVFGFFFDEESALAAARSAVAEGWRVFPAKTVTRAEYLQRTFG